MIVNIAIEFGGAEKSITDALREIDKRRDVEVFFLVENEKMQKLLEDNDLSYKVIKLGIIKKNPVGIIKLIYGNFLVLKEVLKYRPDIIFTNTNVSHMITSLSMILKIASCNWILRDYHFKKIIKNLLEPFADNIICVSEHLKEFYDGKAKYKVIPNGIDISCVSQDYNSSYREKYAKENEIVYGIASRFTRWKGLDYLINAFNLANKNIKNFNGKLLIAGYPQDDKQNEYYLELKALVRDFNLENKVEFIGWIDNPIEFFYNCDVVISSSTTKYGGPESFGRTIIEAWSVKKPVITTDCGGPSYIVRNEETGIKVRETSIESMKEAILNLYYNEDKRKEMGYKGFKEVFSIYNINKISEDYINIINK